MTAEKIPYVGLGLYWNDLTVGQKFRTINRNGSGEFHQCHRAAGSDLH